MIEREGLKQDMEHLEEVVTGIIETLNEALDPGIEQTNALACVMTNILAKNFYSEGDARDALNLFGHSVNAVMKYANEHHLTAWVNEGDVGN